MRKFIAVVFLTAGLLTAMALMNRADATDWRQISSATVNGKTGYFAIDRDSVGYNDNNMAVLDYTLTIKGHTDYYHAATECQARKVMFYEYENGYKNSLPVYIATMQAAPGSFFGYAFDVMCGNQILPN